MLSDAGEITPPRWFDLPTGQDIFHVASVDGVTYVIDPAMVLSADSDLVAGIASKLSCLVVGAGAETVSGTFWLTAAEGASLRRLYFNVVATMTAPFTLGEPLPSEASVDWTDIDGAGVLARFGDLGLSVDVLAQGPPSAGRRVIWEGVGLPTPGPLSAQINDTAKRTSVLTLTTG